MSRPFVAAVFSILAAAAVAENATVPGEVTTPYPTIIHLASEWMIEGDDNLNGVVTVRFRAAGEEKWREGLPLRRVPAGKSRGTNPIFDWKNKHSGSLFDLKPDTEYEIALKLDDPDGGKAERTVRARTRPVPRVPKGGPMKKATPESLAAALAAAEPGDVLLLGPGSYGEVTVPKDGVVLRAEPGATFTRISLRERKRVSVEGATVNGSIDLLGAEECAVRRCTVNVRGKSFGIGATRPPGAKNCYIADNVVTGSTPWTNEAMGAGGKNEGEGIQLTGPGNVVCYNRVTGFRDCISTMEDRGTGEQVCIDIYNNDISVGADDGIEADFCMANCRIVRNRITSSFVGLSSQPGLGGPTYFIRNVMYGLTYAPFKLHRYSQGDVCLHNTVVKVGDGMACFAGQPFDFAYFRNNLCIGGPPGAQRWGGYGGGQGAAARMVSPGPHCSFDYDALGTFKTPFGGQFGAQRFASLADLHKGPHETHAIQVDMSVFDGVEFPDPPVPERKPPDLRPRPGCAVVDKGVRLPNVNDDFLGAAPDLGAYEATQPLPHYGPRPPEADARPR
ncbi:MAG: right-handed parallel beta-helix repeat-containing protein [Planctomycetes bacterium]|nr:right-handed parallel beta-helix repeat-containing protein [Planctomycetota bacterium]